MKKQISWEFTGGEVTEWKDFPSLLAHAKQYDCLITFRTNASLAQSEWKQLLTFTDAVNMELHPEHTMVSQFMINLDTAIKMQKTVSVNINMIQDRYDEISEVSDLIQSKWPEIPVKKKMLFQDPVFNKTPQAYTEEQQIELKRQWGNLVLIDDSGNEEYTDYQTLLLESKNRFPGFQCWAGLEQIIVDAWGRVYRSHCRQNGYLGKLADDEIYWPDTAWICKIDNCRNSFDILSTKRSG
jgi:hypothetical protein